MRKNAYSVLFGVFLLGLALLFLGNLVGWWSVTNFSGWWTVFLIVPGLAGMIGQRRITFGGILLVGLGVILLVRSRGWLTGIPKAAFWIILLALLGLWLIFGSSHHRGGAVYQSKIGMDPSDYPEHLAIFSAFQAVSTSQQLRGGKLTAIFGGGQLDLRQAAIVDGAILEVTSIFGGVEIQLPERCRVRFNGVHILGGTDDSSIPRDYSREDLPLLTIRDTCIFGGAEIK